MTGSKLEDERTDPRVVGQFEFEEDSPNVSGSCTHAALFRVRSFGTRNSIYWSDSWVCALCYKSFVGNMKQSKTSTRRSVTRKP